MASTPRTDRRTATVVDYGLALARSDRNAGLHYMRLGNVPEEVIQRVMNTTNRRKPHEPHH